MWSDDYNLRQKYYILQPYKTAESTWAHIPVQQYGDLNDFESWNMADIFDVVSEFYYACCFHDGESIIRNGEFAGRTVRSVSDENVSHIENLIRGDEYFYLSSQFIEEIILKGHVFSDDTTHVYKIKLTDYYVAGWLNEKDKESTSDSEGWGGNADSNSYYNDDLDMDQQSQEFWDNL